MSLAADGLLNYFKMRQETELFLVFAAANKLSPKQVNYRRDMMRALLSVLVEIPSGR